jgi:hypothetical protein
MKNVHDLSATRSNKTLRHVGDWTGPISFSETPIPDKSDLVWSGLVRVRRVEFGLTLQDVEIWISNH